jgi:carboxypeptidase family protein
VLHQKSWLRCALTAGLFAAGCGGATPPETAPSSVGLLALGCSEVVDGYQCRASYADSSTSSQRDVTGLATWSSSDLSVATVNSVGFVTVLRDAMVAIRASYKGAEQFLMMDVQMGGLRRYYRALSGFVTDAQDGSKISGVSVQIVDGPNANRTTITGADGAYQLYDLELGTFSVRFTKPGYSSLTRTFTLSGDKFNDLSVSLTRASS